MRFADAYFCRVNFDGVNDGDPVRLLMIVLTVSVINGQEFNLLSLAAELFSDLTAHRFINRLTQLNRSATYIPPALLVACQRPPLLQQNMPVTVVDDKTGADSDMINARPHKACLRRLIS